MESAAFELSDRSILQEINYPADIRVLSLQQLEELANAVRSELIEVTSKTGGHLGAGLGVVELTIALHYIFNTPHDKLIFDVGHQAYPHKILTGRREKMPTLRQKGGLSGFTSRAESEYDPFGAAHSSTSISAGLGMEVANKLNNRKDRVICVIGDGAMSAGMAYEAMNNCGSMPNCMVVVLNDNRMSISRPVGAFSHHLTKIFSNHHYLNFRKFVKRKLSNYMISKYAKRYEEYFRNFFTGGTLFEELGFYYLGPIDGHDIPTLLKVLKNCKDAGIDKPFLVHAITKKGHGYPPAENSDDNYHGVQVFDIKTGKFSSKSSSSSASFTAAFSGYLLELAKSNSKIIAISAAMIPGTGLLDFQKTFPERTFDVGIAEQHSVTFAAGLVCSGFIPFVCIYSTFLQRAYDQVVHDVAIQNLSVRFIIDRAGYVGADGQTHAGSFDTVCLVNLPNFTLMAPADASELKAMMDFMLKYNDGPIALRFPKQTAKDSIVDKITDKGKIDKEISAEITLGKGRFVISGSKICIVSFGTMLEQALDAAENFSQKYGYQIAIFDARFAKPIDKESLNEIFKNYQAILVLEEGARGGFATLVLHCWQEYSCSNCFGTDSDSRNEPNNRQILDLMTMPDEFIAHASRQEQLQMANLDNKAVFDRLVKLHDKLTFLN